MKYKLLKELPDLPVGTIIIETDDKYFFENGAEVNRDYYDIFYRIFHRDTKEYYEKIVEKKRYEDFKDGDRIFYINPVCKVCEGTFGYLDMPSNTFLTREEAEDEFKRREWAVRSDKFIPKKGEYYWHYSAAQGFVHTDFKGFSGDYMFINYGLAFRTRKDCEKAIKEHDLVRLFYEIR